MMNPKKGGMMSDVLSISAPKWLSESLMAIFYIALSVSFIFVSQTQDNFLIRGKAVAYDFFAPTLGVISAPVQAVTTSIYDIAGMTDIASENTRLRAENEQLRAWYEKAQTLVAENTELRKLTLLEALPRANYVSSRVIADTGGPFFHSYLLERGLQHGVGKGHAVINADGLVGLIANAGAWSSQMILLRDINARIPVFTERHRLHAVAAGTNGADLVLRYVGEKPDIQVGERLTTSGRGGLLIPGLLVGHVKSITEDEILVEPAVKPEHIDIVQIIDFGRHTQDAPLYIASE